MPRVTAVSSTSMASPLSVCEGIWVWVASVGPLSVSLPKGPLLSSACAPRNPGAQVQDIQEECTRVHACVTYS